MPKAVSVARPRFSKVSFAWTALAAALLLTVAASAEAFALQPGSSHTSVAVNTSAPSPASGRSRTTFTVHVSGESGAARPTGTVSLMLGDASVGSGVLDANGDATVTEDALPRGSQQITAVYSGDASFASSVSAATTVQSNATGVPDFTLTASPASLNLVAGAYGTIIISATPENGFNNAVTLSCTGLPAATRCTFSPASITPDGTNPAKSTLNIQTRAATTQTTSTSSLPGSSRIALALLIPGAFVVFGMRRRAGMRMVAVAAMLLIGGLGLSSCAQRYDYLHHPPVVSPGTPAGTYKITVTGFSNNGSAVTTHSLQYITLTVK